MNLILAVRATVDSDKLPAVPPEVKDAAAPILSSPMFWVAVFVLAGCFVFAHVGGFGKLVMLALGALLVIGWDSQRGVTKAAFGGEADTALMTGLLVAGAFALFKLGTKKKPTDGPADALRALIPGLGGRDKSKRGRRRGL